MLRRLGAKEEREEKGKEGGREKSKERGEREVEAWRRERNTRTGRRETGERSELLGVVLEPGYNWGMPVSSASAPIFHGLHLSGSTS